MYVAMPYFVCMGAMVSRLIHGENTSYVWNSCSQLQFCHLVGLSEDGPCGATLMKSPMMPLCCISFSLCIAMQ